MKKMIGLIGIVAMLTVPMVSTASDHAKNVKADYDVGINAPALDACVVAELPAGDVTPVAFVASGNVAVFLVNLYVIGFAFKPFEDTDAYSWRMCSNSTNLYHSANLRNYKEPTCTDNIPIPRRC